METFAQKMFQYYFCNAPLNDFKVKSIRQNPLILANVYINIASPFPFPDWLYSNSKTEM